MGASLAPTLGEAAFAQEIEDVDDDAIYHLEKIVVAATKRVENAFDVVADIAVANSEELQEQDITSVDELDTIFSDLHIRSRSGRTYTSMTMRGASSVDFYNPSVQLFVDGLPQDQTLLSQTLPAELEQVEVLYGPQSTLYGRGAEGGVISIQTRKPDEETRFKGNLSISNLRTTRSIYANLAVDPDSFFIDGSLSATNEWGQYRNSTDTEDLGDTSDITGQVRARYAPINGNVDIMATYSHNEIDSDEEQFVTDANRSTRIALNYPSTYTMKTDSYGLNASYDLDFATVTSLTGYQDRELHRTIFGSVTPEDQATFSQELRLVSNPQEMAKLDYVIGLYYQNVDFTRRNLSSAQSTTQDINSYAAFSDLTYHVTDRLDVTGGLRFDYEEADADATGTVILSKSTDSSAWSPKLGVQYALTDNFKLHALYNTGFKAGGITRTVTTSNVSYDYDPQITRSIEVGGKYLSDDGIWDLSLTAYASRTSDYQLFVGTQPYQYLQNVGEVESKGVHATATIRPVEPMTIRLSAAYNNSEFTDYNNPVNPGTDLTGNDVPYAPQVTANAQLSYMFDLGEKWGALTPSVGFSYVGQTAFDETNAVKQDAYTLINASLGWEMNEKVSGRLFVNNLLDEEYATYGTAFGTSNIYQMGDGREVGGRLTLAF